MAVEFGYNHPSQEEILERFSALDIEGKKAERNLNITKDCIKFKGEGTMGYPYTQAYLYDVHEARFKRIMQKIVNEVL